jgi:tetratricopeptide (TPR) repeat protein
LVRDAAYDSLLKSRRQELHDKIARVIEDRFPHVAETKPEVLAHHYTQAGLIDQSVDWWEKAGRHALERSANVEAVAHYRSGLAMVADLAADRRGVVELTSLKGYADPETGMVYERARELCLELGDRRRLYPVLYGLWNFVNVGGNHPRAREFAQELIDLAKEHCEVEPMIAGYSALGTTLNFMGRWREAHKALDQCVALYDPEKHATMWIEYTEDLCVQALAQEALTLVNLGDAEGSRGALDRADVLAGRLGHANSIAHPQAIRAMVGFVSGQPDEALRAADVCIAHAEAVGLPFWETLAAVYRGWALACRGEGTRGIADIRAALQSYRTTGAGVVMPLNIAALADACRRAGRKDEALAAVEEGIDTAGRQSEGLGEPELHRLKALVILETAGGVTERGLEQLRKALAVAQAQGSRVMERRIVTDITGWVDRQIAGGAQKQH